MEPLFRVKLAGKVIGISPVSSNPAIFCKEFLTDEEPEIIIELTEDDLEAERQIEGLTGRDKRMENMALCRKITDALLEYDVIYFHGSCIAVDGRGYIFAAPSGIGKSTHTRLWRERLGDRAEMVNDDKPFLKISDDGVTAYGSPWNGVYHLGGNISVPVSAICLMDRDETNHIEHLTAEEAYPYLLGQTYRPKNEYEFRKTLSLVDLLSKKVQLFRLGCNMEPEAADVSIGAMVH